MIDLAPPFIEPVAEVGRIVEMKSIEQRAAEEVTHVFERPVAPEGTTVENPAFDVTPARYVTAIITEKGVARAPYEESLRTLANTADPLPARMVR